MKAGRELDALIAEKVMGWEATADGLYWDARQKRTRLVLGSAIAKKREEMGIENGPGFVFAPSTDIAAAWEVVEKLRQHRDPEWVPDVSANNHTGGWVCSIGFVWPTVIGNLVWETAATAPLAICLAALKAVSQEGQG